MDFMFIQGIPDNRQGTVNVNPDGSIGITVGGSSNLYHFLRHLPGSKHIFYMNSSQKRQSFELPYWPNVIFNEISDPDSHSIALNRCEKFCQQQGKPIINSPTAIKRTSRDGISQLLKNIPKLIVPSTIRIQPKSPHDVIAAIAAHQLQYPVIFRQVGDHGGISTTLLENENQITDAMYAYALDGRDYYLTQYHHYANANGLYRKYRLVVVDGKLYLRHMIVSNQWLIHSASRSYMDAHSQYQQEEDTVLAHFHHEIAPKIQHTIDSITQRLQLDYYGIDCHITTNHDILVFEINANMNIMTNNQPRPNKWEKPIAQIAQALTVMIVHKARS